MEKAVCYLRERKCLSCNSPAIGRVLCASFVRPLACPRSGFVPDVSLVDTPPLLYKYTLARHAISTLRNLELKVTPPAELNDPFECAPAVAGELTRANAVAALKDKSWLRRQYENNLRGRISFREVRKWAREDRDQMIDELMESAATVAQTWRDAHEKVARRELAILSLSRRDDGILLWSHYGDSHRGVALGLCSHCWAEDGSKLLPVIYTPERVHYDLGEIGFLQHPGSQETVIRILSIKSPEWEYEKEYRAVFPLNRTSRKVADDGTALYFKSVIETYFREVVIGARCNRADELALLDILREPRFSHVRVRRASLDPQKFRVIVDPPSLCEGENGHADTRT